MISAFIILGLLLASGAAILVAYAKTGAQETLGGVIVLVGLIIVAAGGIARVAGF